MHLAAHAAIRRGRGVDGAGMDVRHSSAPPRLRGEIVMSGLTRNPWGACVAKMDTGLRRYDEPRFAVWKPPPQPVGGESFPEPVHAPCSTRGWGMLSR